MADVPDLDDALDTERFDEASEQLFTHLAHLETLWTEFEYLFGDSPES